MRKLAEIESQSDAAVEAAALAVDLAAEFEANNRGRGRSAAEYGRWADAVRYAREAAVNARAEARTGSEPVARAAQRAYDAMADALEVLVELVGRDQKKPNIERGDLDRALDLTWAAAAAASVALTAALADARIDSQRAAKSAGLGYHLDGQGFRRLVWTRPNPFLRKGGGK